MKMNILVIFTTDSTGMSKDEKLIISFEDGHKFYPFDNWYTIVREYLKLKDYEYLRIWSVKLLES